MSVKENYVIHTEMYFLLRKKKKIQKGKITQTNKQTNKNPNKQTKPHSANALFLKSLMLLIIKHRQE